jgi:hypothetical protein
VSRQPARGRANVVAHHRRIRPQSA